MVNQPNKKRFAKKDQVKRTSAKKKKGFWKRIRDWLRGVKTKAESPKKHR
jgi:hypothetical protein